MAIAALVMVGCNKDSQSGGGGTEPSDVTAVNLSETTVRLAVGATKQLKGTTTPAGGKITWESANTEIATVTSAGLVTGVKEGETTVTAKCGDKSATCTVIVNDDERYNAFNIFDYGWFGEKKWIDGSDTILTLSDGNDYPVKLATYHIYAWDGNTNFVNGTGFVGDGYVYDMGDVPMYWITEGQYKDYYVGNRDYDWRVYPQEDDDAIIPYSINAGQIDEASYFVFVKAQYGEEEADFDAMMEKTWGAMIAENYDDRLYLDYGLYSGHINKVFYINEDKEAETDAMWCADIDWANMDNDRIWGYLFDTAYYVETYVEGQGGEIRFIEPYDYATVHRVFDANGLFEILENLDDESEEAPRRMVAKKSQYVLGDMSKVHNGVKFEGRRQILRH